MKCPTLRLGHISDNHPLVVNHFFVGLLDFGRYHCLFVLLLVSSWCHHKMIIVMALSSLSLCLAVVIIIPLLSTIVFVGLLVFCHHCCLFVLLLSHHCFCCCCSLLWVIIIVTLCCYTLVVNHCSCWIVGLLDGWIVDCSIEKDSVFCDCVRDNNIGGIGTEHDRFSGLACFQLIFLYLCFSFYFMF